MSDRKSAILAAMLKVDEKDYTKSGKPDVSALNVILEAEGHEPASAKERDTHWAEVVEMSQDDPEVIKANEEAAAAAAAEAAAADGDGDPVEDAKPGYSMVTVTEAAADPVKVWVHGVGSFTLPVGKAVEVPDDALDALRNSDVVFTIGGDA